MKRNGFTLIELLAVIVILAIIALIATPIILGIINDAREKANERSVELYANAVKNGIAAYQLREMKEVVAGTYTKETLPFEVEYDGKVECTIIILSEDSKVSLEGCKVNGGEKEYNYEIEETSSLAGTIGICNPISIQTPGTYTAGDKYECDVDPNKNGYDQTFYVLTSVTDESATSVNLIMYSNIRTGGEAVKESTPTVEQKGLVAWITQTDYEREDVGGTAWEDWMDNNTFGPITAIEYLQEATSGWTNVNPQTVSTFTACPYVGECEIEEMAIAYTTNARMPYYSEVSDYDGTNAYLYDYLDGTIQTNTVSGVYGYWLLSSYVPDSDYDDTCDALNVDYVGGVLDYYVGLVSYGVRPVINLSI